MVSTFTHLLLLDQLLEHNCFQPPHWSSLVPMDDPASYLMEGFYGLSLQMKGKRHGKANGR